MQLFDFVMRNALAATAPARAAVTQAVDFLKSVLAPVIDFLRCGWSWLDCRVSSRGIQFQLPQARPTQANA
jgi:hypothetical protein